MGLISLLFHDPIAFIILIVPLLYSVILHEMAHGAAAYLFGDDTAKRMGRLSLNPVSHIDLFGLASLLLIGFGWAKPVPIDYRNMRHQRIGLFCVSLAGCLMNILIAVISIFFLKKYGVEMNKYAGMVFVVLARINIILAAFNLIPIPPLDGSKILMSFLSEQAQISLSRIEPYGIFILLFLIFSGLLNPVISFMQKLIFSLAGIFI